MLGKFREKVFALSLSEILVEDTSSVIHHQKTQQGEFFLIIRHLDLTGNRLKKLDGTLLDLFVCHDLDLWKRFSGRIKSCGVSGHALGDAEIVDVAVEIK